MASNQTTNYGLNQWEATDQVLRTDFNSDNQKIDAALKGLADKNTELEKKDSLLENAISQCGNCTVLKTQYVGNGSSGQGNPNTLTFPKVPFFIVISGGETNAWGSVAKKVAFFILGGHMIICSSSGANLYPTTWSSDSKTISWFNHNSNALEQMNAAGVNYTVFALLAPDE